MRREAPARGSVLLWKKDLEKKRGKGGTARGRVGEGWLVQRGGKRKYASRGQ